MTMARGRRRGNYFLMSHCAPGACHCPWLAAWSRCDHAAASAAEGGGIIRQPMNWPRLGCPLREQTRSQRNRVHQQIHTLAGQIKVGVQRHTCAPEIVPGRRVGFFDKLCVMDGGWLNFARHAHRLSQAFWRAVAIYRRRLGQPRAGGIWFSKKCLCHWPD